MTVKRLIGTAPSQVSRNSDLGNMAFQNKEGVNIDLLQTPTLRLLSPDNTLYNVTITDDGNLAVGGVSATLALMGAVEYAVDIAAKAAQTLSGNLVASTPTGTSIGTPGQIAFDASYIYVCTATNTWKRVALTSF